MVATEGRILTTARPARRRGWRLAGKILGGVLGALLATHADEIPADPALPARLAAAAAVIHGMAGDRASAGGPVTVLDLAGALPATIAHLLGTRA